MLRCLTRCGFLVYPEATDQVTHTAPETIFVKSIFVGKDRINIKIGSAQDRMSKLGALFTSCY